MKNEIDLLKEEIALLKDKYSLLELRFRIVHEKNLLLEQQLNPVRIVSQWESCQHDYPNPWGATVPPTCKKCGKQAPSYTITSTTSEGCTVALGGPAGVPIFGKFKENK